DLDQVRPTRGGVLGQLQRAARGRMGHAGDGRNAVVDACDSASDDLLALVPGELRVLGGFDGDDRDRVGAAVLDDVVDLALKRIEVDAPITEGGQAGGDDAAQALRSKHHNQLPSVEMRWVACLVPVS